MALSRYWAGRVYGTNTGNLFVKLEGDDGTLAGTLRFNEPGTGIIVYSITASFDEERLSIEGEPETEIEGISIGALKATATLDTNGNLRGEWETTIGSAGTLILFPHESEGANQPGDHVPDQLYTARHQFGAIELNRTQLTELAERLQQSFPVGRVVVTVVAGTEQARYLNDFKNTAFNTDRAELVKIYVHEPESSSTNKVVYLEFGPQFNTAMAQSASQAWALGKLEELKRDFYPFEQSYTTKFKQLGVGVNQLLFIGAVVYLPSLADLQDRTVLMAGVLALVLAVNWLHQRYVPFAAIYLGDKPTGILARATPSLVSWTIAVTAGAAATVLAGLLQGWLELPSIP